MSENGKQAAIWTEAPASATTRVLDSAGYEWLVTARAGTWRELLPELKALREALTKAGAKPANGHAAATQPAAAAETQGGVVDPSWCGIHQTGMKLHEQNGQRWYSHKVAEDGTWCRGKAKQNGSK